MTTVELRKLLKAVESRFPAMYPISIKQRKNLKDANGYTHLIKRKGKPRLEIVIESFEDDAVWTRESMVNLLQLFLLHHEIAHAIQWRAEAQEAGRDFDHDEEWGLMCAKIWRVAFGNTQTWED